MEYIFYVKYFLLCLLTAFSHLVFASQAARPKFEAGIAAGAFWLPDYPASERIRSRTLALPYGIYRGDVLRADREGGLRGRFLKSDRFDLSLSASAAFPANSEHNDARRGMPDLDWIGEIGPRLVYFALRGPVATLNISVPVRFVFSTDFAHFQERGWTFNPELQFRHKTLFDPTMAISFSWGFNWATENLHDYFYEVEPKYAQPGRPTYDAKAGYLGSHMSLSLSKALDPNINVFIGVSQGRYDGAKNRSSPLFKDHISESYFLGLSWGFYFSDEKEERESTF